MLFCLNVFEKTNIINYTKSNEWYHISDCKKIQMILMRKRGIVMKKMLLCVGLFAIVLTGCSKKNNNTLSESVVSTEEIEIKESTAEVTTEIITTEEDTTENVTTEDVKKNEKYGMMGIEFVIPDYWNKDDEGSDEDSYLYLLDSETRETFWVKCEIIPEIMKINPDTLEPISEEKEVIARQYVMTSTL